MNFENWWSTEGSKLGIPKECAKKIWNVAQNHKVADCAELLIEAAEVLSEVRTGTDIECTCWEMAEKLEAAARTL